ncbi:MAG: nucleoid-associated protein [Cytophaga sp.]|uniref:nucleoid-associated protein n=1 Tax=Cytophaga sp. TaxID=29535 RepID=UPI003F7E1042
MQIELINFERIYTHFVGNKSDEEGITISKTPLQLNDESLKELLLNYFTSPFKNKEYNHFHHETDLNLNELYTFCSNIFTDPDSLYIQSINIAKHLYEQSKHPMIKGGEFYVVYFDDCVIDGETTDAIGLFKSETKETFLKIFPQGDGYEAVSDKGIDIRKLDKGCFVVNSEKENGYKVCVVDNTNKSSDAQYWKDDFLKIVSRNDSFHYTQNYMNMCKSFVTEQMPEAFEVSKTDQIDLLNRSVNYFKKNESFDMQAFTNDVIQDELLIDSFKEYKTKFQEDYQMPIVDEFEISTPAVKKYAKVFKSVLKLDRNFHIYIHGNKDLIERGRDDVSGMNFYKIYYNQES